jgi:hypothetical protein
VTLNTSGNQPPAVTITDSPDPRINQSPMMQ